MLQLLMASLDLIKKGIELCNMCNLMQSNTRRMTLNMPKLFIYAGAICMLAACASTQHQQMASTDREETEEVTGSHFKRRVSDMRNTNVSRADAEEFRNQAELNPPYAKTVGTPGQ
ncbi:hypothetical protein KSF73_02350 [Burkholderiaceae bacterium DAT-1]|nr:hypothetical protein [Burkholderiaceae bacterium DAT-1]